MNSEEYQKSESPSQTKPLNEVESWATLSLCATVLESLWGREVETEIGR